MKMKKDKATFAMGCFWNPQKLFDDLDGVLSTRVGYTGGSVENPSYEEVCSGKTGHVEAVEIIFNPDKISYEKLLEIFWATTILLKGTGRELMLEVSTGVLFFITMLSRKN